MFIADTSQNRRYIMKATTAFGKIGKFPVRGTVVNIESADLAPLVNASALAVKVLVAAGLATAGVAIVSAVALVKDIEENSRIPLGSFTQVEALGKTFVGVCLDSTLDFTHDGQPFSVELSRLRRIGTNGMPRGYNVELIDGSKYYDIIPTTRHLSFLSVAGKQHVLLPYGRNWRRIMLSAMFPPLLTFVIAFEGHKKRAPWPLTVCGVTPRDIDDLKRRLRYAIENTRESVIATIGEDVFSHFFK